MKLKYKVGDTVKIREDLEVLSGNAVVKNMLAFKGKTTRVVNLDEGCYTLEIDRGWVWDDDMLEDVVEDIEEKQLQTNKNLMPMILEKLGLEVMQEFKVKEDDRVRRFDEDSKLYYMTEHGNWFPSSCLSELLTGELTIIPPKWKPKKNETYYLPMPNNESLVETYTYVDDPIDKRFLKRNLPCKTPEEAIEKAKIMLKSIENLGE